MTEIMIEEIQDLHMKLHGDIISDKDIERIYDCKLNISTLKTLRNRLIMLHHEMFYDSVGVFNPDDI